LKGQALLPLLSEEGHREERRYDPYLAIWRTLLAEMKTLQMRHQYFERIGPLSDVVEDFIGSAREVEVRTPKTSQRTCK
jgi:hypothetical protein